MSGLVGQVFGTTMLSPPERCRPGLRHGIAPERPASARAPRTRFDTFVARMTHRLALSGERRRAERFNTRVFARVAHLQALSSKQVTAALARVRERTAQQCHTQETLLEALALACHAAHMTLGLMPREGQCRAATALLFGQFVEMPTGEGKTLATALAAAVIALDGTPVHVLTANDYLAERDATNLMPLYAALGLSAGFVRPDMNEEMRRAAYACNVTHLTGKQAGFDWMRDALVLGPETSPLVSQLGTLTNPRARSTGKLLQRGLCAAILDEADSMLLDEARTPLVLAAPLMASEKSENEASIALGLAQMLSADSDYQLQQDTRDAVLTDEGKASLARLAQRVPGTWRATRFRNERVRQALIALHLWHRDHDYVVSAGQVLLVDEQSGRALPDRRLQNGLHGLLELKEHCRPTPENETVASIAFQSFFMRYRRLVGTSGTLSEARAELAQVYSASLVRIAPAKASQLLVYPPLVFASRAEQLDALIEEVRFALANDRPVLVGTRSVEQSRGVGALLTAHRIRHWVLDASQDIDEAALVADAGRAARVTVATNMAGRGTDISLGEGVAKNGGLHLVSLAFNDAARIDRQLIGRTARQGNPGSFRQLWALDDPLLQATIPTSLLTLARHALEGGSRMGSATLPALLTVRFAQRRLEWRHAAQRRQALAARARIARHATLGGHPDHPS